MALLNSLNPQTLGLLGLSLMNAGAPSTTPNDMSDVLPLLMDQNNYQQPSNNYPSNATSNLQNYTQPQNNSQIQNTQNQNYISKLKSTAENTFPDDPLMQKVALSQALLESGINPSSLATNYNNYFGIKGNGANLSTIEYNDSKPSKILASFSNNNSMQDSFNQYKNLINKRYSNLASARNPYDAFNILQNNGYATDPNYAQKLSRIYENYVQPLYTVS